MEIVQVLRILSRVHENFRSNENNGTGQSSNNGNWVHPMRREDYPLRDDKFYDRLATYENFPESCPVSAENLAKAGFRYTGVNDMVLCDYCQGRLQRWEETDDPIVEHARFVLKSCNIKK